jgi:hypothetical protein
MFLGKGNAMSMFDLKCHVTILFATPLTYTALPIKQTHVFEHRSLHSKVCLNISPILEMVGRFLGQPVRGAKTTIQLNGRNVPETFARIGVLLTLCPPFPPLPLSHSSSPLSYPDPPPPSSSSLSPSSPSPLCSVCDRSILGQISELLDGQALDSLRV